MKDSIELTSHVSPPLPKPSGFLWIREMDRLLRGEATHRSVLSAGDIPVSSDRLQLAIVLLGMGYGLCMGSFALLRGESASVLQLRFGIISSTCSVKPCSPW